MFNFFEKFMKQSKINNVKIGCFYVLDDDKNNPFREELPSVLVKDIRSGYVLYAINPGALVFQNESMPLDTFSPIYKLVS